MTATFSCPAAPGGELRVTITAPGDDPAEPAGLPEHRRPWLATELAFLARTCRHLPPAELATVLLRYTSAAVLTGPDYRTDPAVEVGVVAGPGDTWCPPASQVPAWDSFALEHKPFGQVVVLHEVAGIGAYLLRLRPGGTIPWHVHRVMREAELVLGTGMLLQGRRVPRGLAVRWPPGHPHKYHNPTAEVQTVLCVDMPAFIPGDEIEVPPPAVAALPDTVSLHRPDGMLAG